MSLLTNRIVRVGLRGPVASIASQAAGLLQLALLLLHGGATAATDAYLYLFTLGQTPVLLLVVGVVYPMLLNDQRISPRGLRRLRVAAPLLGATFVLAGSLWLHANRGLDGQFVAIAVALLLNAVLQGRLFFRAVVAEAAGDALWIAGIALPANVCACIALAFPWGSSEDATTAMVVALVAGNVTLLAVMARRRIGHAVLSGATESEPEKMASLWYFGLASASHISQAVFTSLAVILPPSSVTIINVATKVVTSVTGTFTNAVMPVLVHQRTDSPAQARRFQRLMIGPLLVVGAGACAAAAVLSRQLLPIAVIVAVWLLASSAAHIAQRTSFRFLPPVAMRGPIVGVAAIVALTAALAPTQVFGVSILLCAYAAIDAVTAAVLLWKLHDRTISVLAWAVFAALVIFPFVSTTGFSSA
ncbi:hypothetical protein [Geodermatophilus sp. CPCC 205761]|uniref:hypothetical protein n=1 Tax=Geodermatophilus sp. CPCC 205761 TaxID=2936597 RepID=UPI003EEE18B8